MELTKQNTLVNIMLSEYEGEKQGVELSEMVEEMREHVQLRPAKNWKIDLPEGAKEFTIPVSGGLERRLGLIVPNAEGKYDKTPLHHTMPFSSPPNCRYCACKRHTFILPEFVVKIYHYSIVQNLFGYSCTRDKSFRNPLTHPRGNKSQHLFLLFPLLLRYPK